MALAVADLGFLRAFGPGMALAVLVGLAVTITFMPALMALLGRALLWPVVRARRRRRPSSATGLARPPDRDRRARPAPHRRSSRCWCSAAMSSGLLWLNIGNPLIRGLPARQRAAPGLRAALGRRSLPAPSRPRRSWSPRRASLGSASELAAFQQVLGDQPGVAGVIGPATSPAEQAFGIVTSPAATPSAS